MRINESRLEERKQLLEEKQRLKLRIIAIDALVANLDQQLEDDSALADIACAKFGGLESTDFVSRRAWGGKRVVTMSLNTQKKTKKKEKEREKDRRLCFNLTPLTFA